MKRALVVAFASMFLFACGGEEEEETTPTADAGVKTDAGTKPDAGSTTTPDAGTTTPDAGTQPSDCPLASDLGTLAAGTGYTTYEAGFGGTDIWGDYALNDETGAIGLELYNAGIFAGGYQTGTFDIADDELNYETCGLCVRAYGFIGESDSNQYFATGGQVKLDSFEGRLTGELINVTFEEVTIDETTFASTPVANGCKTKIVSMPFDDALEDFNEAR